MSLIKGLRQKDHHLTVSPSGEIVGVKNSKGCCNSKKVIAETKEDRLAVAAAAERLTKGPGLNVDMLELYAGVRQKEKQVNSQLSGFFNWFLLLFRSKTKGELRLLRAELQKFGALFDQRIMTRAITGKYFGAGYVPSPASDKKAFDELKRTVPELFSNKPDFTKVPFVILSEGFKYSVMLRPTDSKQPPKKVPIDRLDQLPGIYARAHAKELFEAVRSESAPVCVVSNTDCEDAIGKVELSYPEERDLNKNELSITYYNPAVGKVCKKVDFGTFNTVADLKAYVEACKQESITNRASVQRRHIELQSYMNGLKLDLETSLSGKEYIVRTRGNAPKAISLPFGHTLDEDKERLASQLRALYVTEYQKLYPAEARLISDDQLTNSKTWSEWERFVFELNLDTRELFVAFVDFDTGNKELWQQPTTITFPDGSPQSDLTRMHEKIQEIKEQRQNDKNTVSEICKQSREIAMDNNEACLNAVGQVKIDYDKALGKATISYYVAKRHTIESADVKLDPNDRATIDNLRAEVENRRQLSIDSYEPIQKRLIAINPQLLQSYSVSYDFAGQTLDLIHFDGATQTVLQSFPESTTADDVIVNRAGELEFQKRKNGLEKAISGLSLTLGISADGKEFIVQTKEVAPTTISISCDLSLEYALSELEQKLEDFYIAGLGLITKMELEQSKTLLDRERFGLFFDLRARKFNVYFHDFENDTNGDIDVSATLILADDFKAVNDTIEQIKTKRKQDCSTISEICNQSQVIDISDDAQCLKAIGRVEIEYRARIDKATLKYYDASKNQIIAKEIQVTSVDHLKTEIEVCSKLSQNIYQGIKRRFDAINACLPELFCLNYGFATTQFRLMTKNGPALIPMKKFELADSDSEIIKQIVEKCNDYCVIAWRDCKKMLNDPKYNKVLLTQLEEYNKDVTCLAKIGVSYSVSSKMVILYYYDHLKTATLELSLSSSSDSNWEAIREAVDKLLEARKKDTRASVVLAEAVREKVFRGNLFVKLSNLFIDLVNNTVTIESLTEKAANVEDLSQYGITIKEERLALMKLLTVYRERDNPLFHDASKPLKQSELAQLLSRYVPLIVQELAVVGSS